MKKQALSTYAPMVTETEIIRKNSMKLYSYLLCISGLANYPAHTRIFQHKNLSLTEIKRATGITDKTAKVYLYMLEEMGLVKYQGKIQQPYLDERNFESHNTYKQALQKAAFETWTRRRKEEKNEYYRIPRPEPYTPIPEITLDKLNQVFEASEQEVKLYLICCRYRDICCELQREYKTLTFEDLRDLLHLKRSTQVNSTLRKNLLFLKGIGLIDFTEGVYTNQKGALIPCFTLKEVYYYVTYSIEKIEDQTLEAQEIIERISTYDESCYKETV